MTAKTKTIDFNRLYHQALAAGKQAADATTPTPMVVTQRQSALDDNSPAVGSWYVDGGVCGFAWVILTPATTSFARWLKKCGLARRNYYGGLAIWCPLPTQSLAIKQAWAHAFAKVLSDAGYKAYADSRLD